MMLSGEDFVASLNDQLVLQIFEPLAGIICRGRRLLQNGVGGDHLARNQVLPDAEMLERALRLSAPQFCRGNIDFAETIGLLADVRTIHIIAAIHPFLLLSLGQVVWRSGIAFLDQYQTVGD